MTEKAPGGPLVGIRVIELGAFIAGPYCGQLLADLGADVIKVEPPGAGDPMRQWGLYKKDGRSLWWPVIARNKRSVTLDLRKPAGQALARRLILGADVLIENFRPGTLEKWGLDPEMLRREKPGLVVGRVSGFGQTGPLRERPGFAAVGEAMGGLRNLTGYPDRPPTRVGLAIGDTLAGLYATIGILGALLARDRGGRAGQTVDVAIADAVIAALESVISEYSATGQVRQRIGSTLPGLAPSNLYPTKDGAYVVIAANADGPFRRLATAMGQPELADDPRYATHMARGAHQQELDALIGVWTATVARPELLDRLAVATVPSGPVYDARDVAEEPHYRARGTVVEVDTEEFGPLAMQGIVPKLSGTPGAIRWTGPTLGAHNDDVYGGLLGLSVEEREALRAKGVI
jgi:crotonobetainyl-CoA:carnitine CoA-transferase CaiB-like acyl-CoA transferase